ncbi:MAG TPA: suppressor of fused domain protein [Frankiaceae bacterium]|nr:suppressor of fused domain protein [Frankiaceae bacterium]
MPSSHSADTALALVEAHLLTVLGQDSGRAGVTFLGAGRIDVLRFGPDPAGLVRYVTVGMSREPMTSAASAVVDAGGPRAELVLSLHGLHDEVLRPLAALASSPAVEGVVISPGASLDVGEPLWPGARQTAVLVAEPGGLIPDLDLGEGVPDAAAVQFLPVLPLHPEEAAYKRIHGAAALQEKWLGAGTDLRDPERRPVRLL